MLDMSDQEIQTERYDSDTEPYIRWEATTPEYPFIVGWAETEAEAVNSLIRQYLFYTADSYRSIH